MAEQLHQQGVQHGCLSPRNILRGEDKNFYHFINFVVSERGHNCAGAMACHELIQFAGDLELGV